ncbi:hypothetical protein B296_00052772 [Ensete ventricosum]|uniref:Uncharacterized protein n=1 Tax=Ensete ventricosum TaxID=4639 RepID=A0A426X1Z7_ENSVE|nr:hypothetical protein B296_00052772 [Ensete ventricosum]
MIPALSGAAVSSYLTDPSDADEDGKLALKLERQASSSASSSWSTLGVGRKRRIVREMLGCSAMHVP